MLNNWKICRQMATFERTVAWHVAYSANVNSKPLPTAGFWTELWQEIVPRQVVSAQLQLQDMSGYYICPPKYSCSRTTNFKVIAALIYMSSISILSASFVELSACILHFCSCADLRACVYAYSWQHTYHCIIQYHVSAPVPRQNLHC